MADQESVNGEMMLVTREQDRVIILEIRGDVDIHHVKSLGRELEKILCAGKHILFNLSRTYYLDSIGLSLLIAFQKKLRKAGKFFDYALLEAI
ncbi:MAG: STAS domain-containing protein [Candidatus Eremiobacteraeota bacterium]|nr:STAS domain-containing protein [Candidatus Eremiobacteraeota bacterium]